MRRALELRGAAVAALLLAGAIAARAQAPVNYLSFTPAVIRTDATEPVLIEAEVPGRPTRVSVLFSPRAAPVTEIALRDNGGDGDRASGDDVYSGRLPVAPILAARTDDDVYRVFVGYLEVYSGSTRTFRGNLFADVFDPGAGSYPIARLSQFVQATSRLVNIHDPTYFLTNATARVGQEFYRSFGDDYDGLNIIYWPMRFQNRTHAPIRNDVRGIGLPISNGSAGWGSAGRLQGVSQFPIPGFFDGANRGFLHEFGHQWVNHLTIAPFGTGRPHWPISEMASGVMGFSIGGQGGQGGDFPCAITEQQGRIVLNPPSGAPPYNDLDLYLMGLMPAAEVKDQIVFSDQSAVAQLRCTGQEFTGPVERVNAQTIIGAVGPRVPAYGDAPANFRLATILVTRDGLASAEMMWFYSWLAERAEWRVAVPTHSGFAKETVPPFFAATRGRGTVEMDIDLGQPDFALAPADGEMAVGAGGAAAYTLTVSSRRRSFDSPVVLSCGSLPAGVECRFEPAEVAPGSSGGRVTLTVATTASTIAGRHVIQVTGRAGEQSRSTAIAITVQ